MKITNHLNNFTKQESYQIIIKLDENLSGEEIAECFKSQYPKNPAIICFSEIEKIKVGILIVGLNLK